MSDEEAQETPKRWRIVVTCDGSNRRRHEEERVGSFVVVQSDAGSAMRGAPYIELSGGVGRIAEELLVGKPGEERFLRRDGAPTYTTPYPSELTHEARTVRGHRARVDYRFSCGDQGCALSPHAREEKLASFGTSLAIARVSFVSLSDLCRYL